MNTYEKMVQKADRELTKVAQFNMDLIYFGTVLSLHDVGWRENRIGKFMDLAGEVFKECANMDKSMVQMCDEEVGIELRTEENKSWEDAPYLNAKKWHEMEDEWRSKPASYRAAWLVKMKYEMQKWMKPQIMASVVLALYRKEKWGLQRVQRLVNSIDVYITEFNLDTKAMQKAVKDRTGLIYTHTTSGELALLEKGVEE